MESVRNEKVEEICSVALTVYQHILIGFRGDGAERLLISCYFDSPLVHLHLFFHKVLTFVSVLMYLSILSLFFPLFFFSLVVCDVNQLDK